MLVDVVVCMVIPMVIKALFSSELPAKFQAWLATILQGQRTDFVRSISYETKSGGGYYYGRCAYPPGTGPAMRLRVRVGCGGCGFGCWNSSGGGSVGECGGV